MKTLTHSKLGIRVAIINFKDVCMANEQQGIVTTAIADELHESLSKEQIELLIEKLKTL